MAIQMRRGNSADFDASRMKAGEFAVCLDNGYVYMTLSQGNVIRLGTADSMDEAIALCEEYAKDSEAWANGKKDGVDVPNTDPAYHNNSKYYKDVAQGIVDDFADKIPTANVSRTSGANYVVIRIHDQYGDTVENVYDGADGQDGQDGRDGADGITPDISATATVDGNTGTPSVNVTTTGSISTPVINFAFSNLKGAQGQTGAAGRGVTDIEMGGTGRAHPITVTYSDGTTDNIGTIYDGESGTGTGDMLKSTYDVDDNGYVDYAEAITDGVNSLDYDDIVAGLGGGNAEELVRDTVGWTGKNLLHIPESVVTQEINDVVFTVNRNASGEVTSIVANGTASANATLYLMRYSNLSKYNGCIMTGCPASGGDSSYFMLIQQNGSPYTEYARDNGSGVTVTNVPDSDTTQLFIRIVSGYTANNLTFYPMLRYADIPDSTYEPYHETVDKCKFDRAEQRVLGAKNLLDKTNVYTKSSALTLTQIDTGINAVVSTSAAHCNVQYLYENVLKHNTAYIISTYAEITSGKCMIQIKGKVNSGDTETTIVSSQWITSSGDLSVTFDVGNYNEIKIYLFVTDDVVTTANVNYKNLMLRLASDPDNTYAPYAMTNKQLTDSVNGKIDNPSTKSNGQVLTYNGSSWVAQTPSGGNPSWSSVTSKPFSTVDTTSSGGLTISNDTLDAKVKSVSVASSGTAYWNDAIEQQVLVNGTDAYTIEGTTYMETGTYTDSSGIREFHFINNTFITTSKAYTCYCDVLGALPTDIVITSGDAKVKFRTSDNVSRCRLYIR